MHVGRWWIVAAASGSVAMLASGWSCRVSVPDTDEKLFACKDNGDCAKDYGCWFPPNRPNGPGYCTPHGEPVQICDGEPCNGACVRVVVNGVTRGECKPACKVDADCHMNEGPGLCAAVYTPDGRTVSACTTCYQGCPGGQSCSKRNAGPHDYPKAAYCNKTGESCQNGVDSDGDSVYYCEDLDCGGAPECRCGNNILDSGEDCDGIRFSRGTICSDYGAGSTGTVACTRQCTVDLSGCSSSTLTCGNGGLDSGEDCDGSQYRFSDCRAVSDDFGSGSLACQACSIDTGGCVKSGVQCGLCRDASGNPISNDCGDPKCSPTPICRGWSAFQTVTMAGNPDEPAIAMANGSLWVAWTDRSDSEIHARSYTVAGWGTDMVVSQTSSSTSALPALSIDRNGAPVIAWSETMSDSTQRLYVRRWSGSSWDEIAGGSASGNGVSGPTPVTGVPSLSTPTSTGDLFLAAMHTNGQVEFWTLGATSFSSNPFSANNGSSPSVARNPTNSGDLFTAWLCGSSVCVARLWGWTSMGPSDSNTLGISNRGTYQMSWPTAAYVGGEPIVAWRSSEYGGSIFVSRFTGSTWEPLPGATAREVVKDGSPSGKVAFASADSHPIVAFEANTNQIKVLYWENRYRGWRSLSGSGCTGLPSSPMGNFAPSIAVGQRPDNSQTGVCVAYVAKITAASQEIRLTCHDLPAL